MSAALLEATLCHIRALFTRAELATVEAYGGQFGGEEIDKLSYNCPVVLVTVLGWSPETHGTRLSGKHVRNVRMAAFVATKHAKRELRMQQAMQIADKLAMGLRLWQPAGTPLETIAPLEADPECENLYGRAIDKVGQALWLVRWEQCVRPAVPLPQLYELLHIDVYDTTRQGAEGVPVAAPQTPNSAPLVVTEDVTFAAVAGV
jgi:phage gp37-like protein